MADYGAGASGAASGATAGASIGTAILPGWGTAIGAGAGAIAGGIAGLFGGGGSKTSSGYTLPPAYEAQLLSYFDSAQQNYAQQLSQIQSAMSAFRNKISLLDKGIAGTIPPKELTSQLAQHNAQLANALGMSAEDLVSNGFINEDDKSTLDQMRALSDSGNTYTDPQLQNQLNDQRAQLNQTLAQQGASPAARAQALAQFDRDAQQQIFARSQNLKQTQSSLLGNTLNASLGAKNQGFNQAVGAFGVGQNQLQYVQNSLLNRGSLANMGLQGFLAGNQAVNNQIGQQGALFNQVGQFKLSGETKNNIKKGAYNSNSAFSRDPNFDYRAIQEAERKKKESQIAFFKGGTASGGRLGGVLV